MEISKAFYRDVEFQQYTDRRKCGAIHVFDKTYYKILYISIYRVGQ